MHIAVHRLYLTTDIVKTDILMLTCIPMSGSKLFEETEYKLEVSLLASLLFVLIPVARLSSILLLCAESKEKCPWNLNRKKRRLTEEEAHPVKRVRISISSLQPTLSISNSFRAAANTSHWCIWAMKVINLIYFIFWKVVCTLCIWTPLEHLCHNFAQCFLRSWSRFSSLWIQLDAILN